MSEQTGKKVILILEANPNGPKPLDSMAEVDVIRDLWESRQVADYFELPPPYCSASRDRFMSALSRYKNVVVHFIGHASEDALYLEATGSQRAEAFLHEELVDALRLYADSIDCVILNGCDTNRHACAIAEFIPVVIGTSSKIEGDKATTYTKRFYESLFKTHCFEKAHEAWKLSVATSERGIYRFHHTPREELNRLRVLRTTWPDYMQLRGKLAEVLPSHNDLRLLCEKCFPLGKMGDFPSRHCSKLDIIDWMAGRRLEGHPSPLLYLLKLLFPQIEGESRNFFETWFFGACNDEGVSPNDIDTMSFMSKKMSDAVYALIEITRLQSSSKYCNAQVWVHSQYGTELVLVCESKQAIDLELPESIKGFTDQLIEAVLSSQYAPDYRESWVFEFILPLSLLSLDVEAWMDSDNDILGHDYPVVIRSWERVSGQKKKWLGLWKPIENLGHYIQDCAQVICSQRLHNTEPRLLVREAEDTATSVIFKSPPHEDLLSEYIRRGIPVLLWPRYVYDNELGLDVLFCNELLGSLPTIVKKNRRASLGQDSTHIGKNLILLWDDRNRLLPQPSCISPNNAGH